jgi:hypothetical protein
VNSISVVRRRALTAVATAAIAVTLTGCGSVANGEVAVEGGSSAAPAPTSGTDDSSRTPDADQPTKTATKSASPKATLPAGDPGPDAPGTDDPNGDLGNSGDQGDQPKHAAKTHVPRTAVLDAETVAAVAGGSWTSGPAPADSCATPRPAKLVATRSAQLTSSPDGATANQIVETVATHRGVTAAVAAVRALEQRLLGCHATSAPDPRIGDASVQLTLAAADGTTTVVTAAAVEGVTFVLSGSGPVTGEDTWSALTDIALGSTCVAAVDGCH